MKQRQWTAEEKLAIVLEGQGAQDQLDLVLQVEEQVLRRALIKKS